MDKWVLIVWISTQPPMWSAIAAFDTEAECYASIQYQEPGTKLTCLHGKMERTRCYAEPQGKGWHYRTKIPGFSGNVRGDRCWYDGPAMKPREELYWPSAESAPLEIDRPSWARPTSGWEHKE